MNTIEQIDSLINHINGETEVSKTFIIEALGQVRQMVDNDEVIFSETRQALSNFQMSLHNAALENKDLKDTQNHSL